MDCALAGGNDRVQARWVGIRPEGRFASNEVPMVARTSRPVDHRRTKIGRACTGFAGSHPKWLRSLRIPGDESNLPDTRLLGSYRTCRESESQVRRQCREDWRGTCAERVTLVAAMKDRRRDSAGCRCAGGNRQAGTVLAVIKKLPDGSWKIFRALGGIAPGPTAKAGGL
jgi:hypothetical protein